MMPPILAILRISAFHSCFPVSAILRVSAFPAAFRSLRPRVFFLLPGLCDSPRLRVSFQAMAQELEQQLRYRLIAKFIIQQLAQFFVFKNVGVDFKSLIQVDYDLLQLQGVFFTK